MRVRPGRYEAWRFARQREQAPTACKRGTGIGAFAACQLEVSEVIDGAIDPPAQTPVRLGRAGADSFEVRRWRSERASGSRAGRRWMDRIGGGGKGRGARGGVGVSAPAAQ